MNNFSFNWDRMALGRFPIEEIEKLEFDVNIEQLTYVSQIITLTAKDNRQVTLEEVFKLGMLVHSIYINK
jgi:hypothetical protein